MTGRGGVVVEKPERSGVIAKTGGDVEITEVDSAAARTGKTPPVAAETSTIVVGGGAKAHGEVPSAEVDKGGRPYLADQEWKKMGDAGGERPGLVDRVFSSLYGNLPREDRLRVAWLAGTLFFIIGGYWLLRSLKDAIVKTTMGADYIPKCKMMSLVVVFALVFVYNKLVDAFPKHQLFYLVGGFYFVVFAGIAALLADPVIGIQNETKDPSRLIGWVSYCAIESFGSICVSLYWAFVNSSMNVEGAKSAYGLIIAGGNLGSILGPTLAATQSGTGVPMLYAVAAGCMGLMVAMVWGYVRLFGVDPSLMKSGSKKEGAGVMEGVNLFLKYDYIKGIFAMSCLFMVEVTILDYMMKKLAEDEFDSQFPTDMDASTKAYVAFMGTFGQITNMISFGFSLLGTSMVIRRLGLRKTLLAFPILCLCVVLMVMSAPKLYTLFLALILLKGFSYSLNNPCKEILYQPTSSAVKFKSKSWIDIFGARMSKATGSLVTNAFSSDVPLLVMFGGSVAAGSAAFLIWVAWQMGFTFESLMETGEVVGGASERSANTLEALATDEETANEQDAADTSCGVLEEGQAEEAYEVREGTAIGRDASRESESKKSSIDI